MLQDMKLVKDRLGLGHDVCHSVEIRLMHVGADSLNSSALKGMRQFISNPARLASVQSHAKPHISPRTKSDSTVQKRYPQPCWIS